VNILALDLGSTTGIASGLISESRPSIVLARLWAAPKELRDMRKNRMDRRGDIRVTRFFSWLTTTHQTSKFDLVVFEDVQFSSSTAQTQLWASFRSCVWIAFPKSVVEAVPVGTLKKFSAGFGSADKAQMGAALKRCHLDAHALCADDNAVDACWLWYWAKHNLLRTPL